MKKHIGTGKTIIKTEWIKSNLVVITYDDFTTEQMTRVKYDQVIRQVRV